MGGRGECVIPSPADARREDRDRSNLTAYVAGVRGTARTACVESAQVDVSRRLHD